MSALNRIYPEDYAVEYAAGTLSPAKRLMMACQANLCAEVRAAVEQDETIAASFMVSRDCQDTPLSDGFLDKTLAALPPAQDAPAPALSTCVTAANDMRPAPLLSFMNNKPIEWSFFAPGMQSMSLWKDGGGAQLWLLKVKGGKCMPEHTHIGEEWSLILQGSYHVGNQQFVRGDLHVEDEHCTHIPMIYPGEDCICLVYTEGPLQPTGLIPKLLMPFARI